MYLYIPNRDCRNNQKSQCFTPQLQHLLNKTHSLRKKAKKSPSEYNEFNLNKAENTLQEQMLATRQNFESNLVMQFAQTNSSKIYKYISTLTRSRSIPNVMFLDSNDDSISNGFN